MKKLLLTFVFLFAGQALAKANLQGYSLGAVVGDPTGLSGAYEYSPDVMIDGALSYSFGGRSGVQIHSDYLRFMRGQITAGDTDLDLYYGIGGRFIFVSGGEHNGKVSVGPRVPVGLFHRANDPKLDFFGEVAGVLNLTPGTSFDIDIGVGLRFRF